MQSDIEIAQQIKLLPIWEIAKMLGITDMDLILPYGNYKAKLSVRLLEQIKSRPTGKLVLVTAITPTKFGEGKTTVSIGLSMAFNRLGKKSIVVLRQPSLGPVFGIKGGAAGGGYSQVLPMEDINLHFTGDIHAVSSAHNLLSAMLDNSLHFDNPLGIDEREIFFPRTIDMNDRVMRSMVVGLGGKSNGPAREDSCVITAASEIMAILALALDRADLKKRLARILVALSFDDKPITAGDLGATGAMAALLKDAIKPNLVQTTENTPALIHTGPFANIAHGTASIIATNAALRLAELTVIEAGFGSDLGAEKFVDLVAPIGGLKVDGCVLVATMRALKHQGGAHDARKGMLRHLLFGLENLRRHIDNCRTLGMEPVVAVNRFEGDSPDELNLVVRSCEELGVRAAICAPHSAGSKGCEDLAQAVLEQIEQKPAANKPIYDAAMRVEDKIETVAQKVYGAERVVYTPRAERDIKRVYALGYDKLPICIAKTPLSLSDDPDCLGACTGFKITISAVHIRAGAGYLVPVAGEMELLPGLAKRPNALKIDIADDGRISGLS
ncbi:MAG: formate--tetrahydrofolate ligase [candidate division WOR-3 bacterium]|jgi:formate--tetrahydrofolate ligase|nr:formate--tetrahydrofolate ligase [candidate division WOR-3 bacterium]MCR4423272.1 formate--tetrahydrofolate ligase [candidate division WOR-3 bacterium]MDH7518611.1 formate--tetrahydrofolate ligase [bacterium]